jgi:hypothetical protein
MQYEYRCNNGHTTLQIRSVASRNEPATCEVCGGYAFLVPSVPASVRVGKYGKGGSNGA